MFSTISRKFQKFYKPYVVAILSTGYIIGELGHCLIGVTAKATATDLHYGDISCQFNSTVLRVNELPVECDTAKSIEICESLQLNGTRYCEWTYDGKGLEYQILAAPGFITVYTAACVIFGFAADRFNRVRLLAVTTAMFSVAVILQGLASQYWHLLIFRMLYAVGEAGCTPFSTGLLSDLFTQSKRGLVMSIFNWGVYGGYGISFPFGRHIAALDIWGLGWRVCYYVSGVTGLLVALLIGLTLDEPERKDFADEGSKNAKEESIWRVICQPPVILLMIAAGVRHTAGMCFTYNSDLYYRQYFPDYDLSWWLFTVTIVSGSFGVVLGGYVSDRFVAKMGVRSRVAFLFLSQALAAPGAFGSLYFSPVGAIISLGISYFFAEMWLGIVFAVVIEIVPLSMRSTITGIFLFFMNTIGGDLPILVEPVSKAIGYRESLYIFYVGSYIMSSTMFLIITFLMDGPRRESEVESSVMSGKNHENTDMMMAHMGSQELRSNSDFEFEHSEL
ncbi:hypothetical protein QAD02_018700 [Eretmocerus hayati]|uniref:Uncharacterized protein n=1 Tax=Eretmocerus hayati TaxID=131215 RepID=A0ACC2PIJ9_9HYME|nr:hypothetical protein QAD02_018700 [Eretmocerus hayati]